MKVIPAKWQENDIRYLGIRFCRTNEQMIHENIDPIISYMEDEYNLWDKHKYRGLMESRQSRWSYPQS